MMDGKDRVCKTCNWSKFSWCGDGKRVSNEGDCPDWKLDKLSDASKKKQAAIQKAAHARDMKKRAKK
jgi:hypothetical protein